MTRIILQIVYEEDDVCSFVIMKGMTQFFLSYY